MITNKITIDKIVKAVELVCPMLKQNLIFQAFIVGSVAKGTVKEDSDIDIYLVNPDFKKQRLGSRYGVELVPSFSENIEDDTEGNIYTDKIVKLLINLEAKFKWLPSKHGNLWQELYKNEIFHFMYDYESESIKKAGEYIEITEELCNEVLS
jgi:predicted nucleotidyltransferase